MDEGGGGRVLEHVGVREEGMRVLEQVGGGEGVLFVFFLTGGVPRPKALELKPCTFP